MLRPTILKFGGTSMADAHTWKLVLDIISTHKTPFVVVSATSSTTRELLTAAEKALYDLTQSDRIAENIQQRHSTLVTNFSNHYSKKTPDNTVKQRIDNRISELRAYLTEINNRQELTDQLKDGVAAIGEQLSSYLLAECGNMYGLSTCWIDAAEIIQTNSDHTQAVPNSSFIKRKAKPLRELLDDHIPIMGGYYGKDKNGATTTLGFEGSDFTASLMGEALSAEAIEIWTDVSGIYTCDPSIVSQAKPIPQLSFQEATELAYFGAKVLHPSTTKPASSMNIPLWVKNIFDPNQPGTLISDQQTATGIAKAITFKRACKIITVTSSDTVMGYDFLAGIFNILKCHHMAVEMVITTEASVSIVIDPKNGIEKAVDQLQTYGSVEIKTDQGIISLIGCAKGKSGDLITKILANLEDSSSLELISFSKLKGNLNMLVNDDQLIPAVKAIHKQIFD